LELKNMTDAKNYDNVVVERVEVPAWRRDLLLGGAHSAELLILPVEVRDGRGVYRDADLSAVKALRAAGVKADWAHPASERTFRSDFGADLPVAIGMFIMQALGEHSVAEIAKYLEMRVRQALGRRLPDAEPPTYAATARMIQPSRPMRWTGTANASKPRKTTTRTPFSHGPVLGPPNATTEDNSKKKRTTNNATRTSRSSHGAIADMSRLSRTPRPTSRLPWLLRGTSRRADELLDRIGIGGHRRVKQAFRAPGKLKTSPTVSPCG
jgi:hypothetical protein